MVGRPFFNFFSILVSIGMAVVLTVLETGLVLGITGQVMRGFGLLIYILGLIIRYWSILELGDYFTRATEVKKEHAFISSGLYTVLRHPLYLACFFECWPIFLFPKFFATLFAICIMVVSLNLRMMEEEKMMEVGLGNRYREWKEKRYRFIPYFY